MTACRRCNNLKASKTPEQAGLQLIAVPFKPTYAEYIYLKGRRVLADQMEYLLAHFPRTSPLHARLKAQSVQLRHVLGSIAVDSAVLYLIDASVFVLRSWHSVPIAVVDLDGNPVNALHGFGRFLGDLIERVRPEPHRGGVRRELVRFVSQRCFPRTRRIASRRPRN